MDIVDKIISGNPAELNISASLYNIHWMDSTVWTVQKIVIFVYLIYWFCIKF